MLKELLFELVGMFVGDAALTLAILVVVAVTAVLVDLARIEPLIGGGVLVVGCLVALVENVRRSARRKAEG